MKTRLLIIIGIIIAITISVSALIIIDYIELESRSRDSPSTTYETNQQFGIVMNHCINNFDLDGVDQFYFNNTHYIWTGECAWKLLNEPDTFSHGISLTEQDYYLSPYYSEGITDDFEIQYNTDFDNDHDFNPPEEDEINYTHPFPTPDNELQNILDNCDCQESGQTPCKLPLLSYQNDTHFINNIDCKWEEIGILIEWENNSLKNKFKDLPEVVAFYAKYDNAQASVREDHISYFAGSDDTALMRMNVFFDENQTLVHIDAHCYFQKVHQYEIPQEDIIYKLEKYDCKK